MAEDGTLDWLNDEKKISVNVTYDDPTPTPPLAITPGDTDSIVAAAKKNATQMATKMYGKDVRSVLAQWILASGKLLQCGVMSLQEFQRIMNIYQAALTKRMESAEQRVATAEGSIVAASKEITDAAAAGGEPYALEVQQARSSSLYGDFSTVDARFESLEAAIAPYVANTSTTATIPVNLGRQVPISVSYYEYALGTEPDGLGTGPYGLGGSEPQDVPYIAISWSDANTAKVALPVVYKDVVADGTLKAMADGSWTLTAGYKTLRFVADA